MGSGSIFRDHGGTPLPSFAEMTDNRGNIATGRDVPTETRMNQETFNLSIRKFLKMVGINSQREIEQAVTHAVESGTIKGTESFPAHVTLEVAGLKINVKFDGEIKLQ